MIEDLIEWTSQKKTRQNVNKSGQGDGGDDSRKKNQHSKRPLHI
jgi:hypothetical protein